MSQITFPISQPRYLLQLPTSVLQEIAARVESLKDLVSFGKTCRTLCEVALGPQAKSWKALNERYCIHLRKNETPKEGVKRFFEQFVECFLKRVAKIMPFVPEPQNLLRTLEEIKSTPYLIQRFRYCRSFLPTFKIEIVLEALEKGHADCAEMCLKQKVFQFPESSAFQEIFNTAAQRGHLQVIKTIHSMNPIIFKFHYQKPFISAAQEGHLSVIDFFLQKVSCNEVLTKAKVIALAQGRLDIILRLFICGKVWFSEPPLLRLIGAIYSDEQEKVESFKTRISEDDKFFAYYCAIGVRNFKLMEILFDQKFLVNKVFEDVFLTVVRRGDEKMTQFLMTKLRESIGVKKTVIKIIQLRESIELTKPVIVIGNETYTHFSKRELWFTRLIIEAIKVAAQKGHRALIKNPLLASIGKIIDHEELVLAGVYGIDEIVDLIGDDIPHMPKEVLFSTAMGAVQGGHLNFLKKIVPHLAGHEKFSWLFLSAARCGYLDCIQELLHIQPMDTETKTLAIAMARLGNFDEMEKFLNLKRAATGRVFFVFFKKN